MNRAAAEIIALRALAWIVADETLSGAFLAASGADAAELRTRAGDAEFLAFVLDFLLSDERAVLAFCAASGEKPDAPLIARTALPGGDLPNWT
ncbi:DUF3572 domain-containing protein [Pikeienuella sp. HZG-20]|uniref:DUF3572 domain-containing protein n=1 Tax=Paludibacillus litoralis TaxID=3133267 RepID=UPI0030EF67DE